MTALLTMLCSVAAVTRLADILGVNLPTVRPGVVDACGVGVAVGLRVLALAQVGWLFAAAVEALGLVFDARYRPLSWPTLAAPALLLLALALLGDRLAAGAREERLLAAVCAGCAPLIVVQEGLANTQAVIYAALLLALSVAILLRHRPSPATLTGRTRTNAASSTAGAARRVE